MIKAADVVTTTTDVLAKRVKKYNKNVKIVPNSLDFNRFKRREGNHERLRIGYTGGSTHWEDLGIVLDVIKDLQDKYDFDFLVQGMCGTPLVGEMYNYKFIESEGLQPEKRSYYLPALETFEKLRKIKYSHIPFYPPELYPDILRTLDIDIGIAPLKDNQFNKAKSCIKMYEYAAVGAAVLTSDVLPYSKENKYTAKNTYKDWYKKLERLIKDEDFRDKVWKKQYDFVEKNVDVSKVVDKWEKVFQGE
jgi:glycosyltransferase involved in cell wall biosynthesis